MFNTNALQKTLNNEKTILVVYIAIENMNKTKGLQLMCQIKKHIEDAFNPIDEDDTMVFIYLPSDHFELKVFSPKAMYLSDEEITKFKETFNKFISENNGE